MEILKYILIVYLTSFLINFLLYKKIVEAVKKHKRVIRYLGSEMSVEEFVNLVTLLPILNTCMILGFIKNKIWP